MEKLLLVLSFFMFSGSVHASGNCNNTRGPVGDNCVEQIRSELSGELNKNYLFCLPLVDDGSGNSSSDVLDQASYDLNSDGAQFYNSVKFINQVTTVQYSNFDGSQDTLTFVRLQFHPGILALTITRTINRAVVLSWKCKPAPF